jgi:hypothetical protein
MALDTYSIIGSAVASYLGSAMGTAMGTVVGSVPVYQDLAPQGDTPPYVVFSLQAGPDVYVWDGEETQAEYFVRAVSNRENSAEATRVYSVVHAKLQDASLTMPTGVTLLRCRRAALVKYQDPKRFWHVGGLYRIDVLR